MYNRLFQVGIMLILVVMFAIAPSAGAQDEDECDIANLMLHQVEHGMELTDFPQLSQTDLDQALEALYRTGIAYQALAVGCGFDRLHQVEDEHADEHGESNDHADDAHELADEHNEEDDEAVSEEVEAAIAMARDMGDAENGEVLFNTLQPETGFACATCHLVDSMAQLVGPGLMGVGDPSHDPSAHMAMEGTTDESVNTDDHDADIDDQHAEADQHDDDDDGSMMGNDMAMMDDDEMAAMMSERGDNPVEYIRTSILNPSAYVVAGFPDDLMPKVYAEIFTEQEINDLIAYLLTL